MIEPRVLKGFRDALPAEEIRRRDFIARIERTLRTFGYAPIDTPALEYKEVLTGKSGDETDRQVFLFQDNGGRDVGMRFDLTVPLARFVATNEKDLIFPFKRYHIAKVWRGEKPQRGRFREFFQADFDIIGSDALGSDVEILSLVHALLTRLNIDTFQIHVNDRSLLHTIFEKEGVAAHETQILAIVDKTYKIGHEAVAAQLQELLGEDAGSRVARLLAGKVPAEEFFGRIARDYGLESPRLQQVLNVFAARGLGDRIVLDTAITRGLDYYTGLVFETFLSDALSIGSISSGGRYANLTGLFSPNVHNGIGGSIGLDRLLAYLAEKESASATAQVDAVIFNFRDEDLVHYLEAAAALREQGLSAEVYPEAARIKKQITYASRRGARLGIFLGETEIQAGILKAKNLEKHEEREFRSASEVLTAWPELKP